MKINSKQRAYLRGLAASEPTIMQIGKDGISENLIKTVSDALEARELIKCRVLDTCPYKAKEAAEILCEYIGCDSVQVIGSKFFLFMQKKKDSQYEI